MHTQRNGCNRTVYQLISSPAVFASEDDALNTVYSVLTVQSANGASETAFVYDVTRIKSVSEKILSEVSKNAPPLRLLADFISELL